MKTGTQIPFYRINITEDDVNAVADVLRSGQVAMAETTREFEHAVASFTGAKHAIAVNNGSAALHLSLLAAGVGPGDEVITTAFTYIASCYAILHAGARPVFVDIDPATYNVDADEIAAAITPRTRAILPVHTFGRPCDMDAIISLARAHNLAVVEDACEGIGSRWKGRHLGTIGLAGTLSFFANKQITTAEGGAILTDDDRIAEICRSLRHQGRSGTGNGGYVRLGYNYKPNDLTSALGLSQFRRLEEEIAHRRQVANWYFDLLHGDHRVHLPLIPNSGERISWFAYTVRLDDRFSSAIRDRLIAAMAGQGIECMNYFPALHLMPYLRSILGYGPGSLPECERVSSRTLALPLSSIETAGDAEQVTRLLFDCLRNLSA
jgi:perosamine synthetase